MPTHLRIAVAALVVGGAVAFGITVIPSGGAEPDPPSSTGTWASASGGAAGPPTYPGVVAVQFDRAQAAVGRGEAAADERNPAKAAAEMNAAILRMRRAWSATSWLIAVTPPPAVPPDGRAGAGGAGGGGITYAAPPETGLGFFGLQHDISVAVAGLLGNYPTLDATLVTDLAAIARVRDRAITRIAAIPSPPPASGRAGAGGAAVASTFDSVMPSVPPLLDDEIQALKGALALRAGSLSSPTKAVIRAAIATDQKVQARINTRWPPLAPND